MKISVSNKSLIKTDFPFNISISVLTELAAEAHLTEGQMRSLKSTKNKLKSLRLQFSTRGPTVSKRLGQNLECNNNHNNNNNNNNNSAVNSI